MSCCISCCIARFLMIFRYNLLKQFLFYKNKKWLVHGEY
nr:MAG TPA: hypothetical protein [Caudoviricetes sp.]